MPFPIVYFEGNVIVNRRREAWALYRLTPWHYEHLGTEARLALLWRLSRLFWELEGTPGQLLLIPRQVRAASHLARLAEEAQGPLAPVARAYCRELAGQLVGARDGLIYDYYLALRLPPLGPVPASWRAYLQSLWQEPRRLVEELLGLAPPRLLDYELSAALAQEEALYGRLTRVCGATRATPAEIAWLIRRGFWRGLGDPPPRTGWTPDAVATPAPGGAVALTPVLSEIATLTEGELDLRHPRRVALTQITEEGEATAYTSFGYVADFPDDLLFPGCEWLYSIQDLPFPVEVCLRWSTEPHGQVLAALRRKRLEIQDQDHHTRRAGEDVPLSLLAAQDQALLLEQDLKQRRFPMVLASAGFAVWGRDLRELNERIQQVRTHLAAFQIGFEVPAGDQLLAFLDFVPGTPQQVHDYIHRLPPEVLAGAMFLGTHALGDQTGPYIGRTGVLRRPVYLDPALPPLRNRSASAAFLGTLGSGKSFAANLLTYLAVVFRGAQALILDPKGERGNWPQDLPELAGHLQVITLGPGAQDAGRLDPFILGRGLDEEGWRETGNLAVSLPSFLANVPSGDPRFLALMAAVEDVARCPTPSLGKVVERLAQMGSHDPGVADLARYFQALSRRAYASLIFGHGHEEGLDLRHRVNVLQLQQLVMPPASKPRQEYTLEELLSVALLHALTAFATQFTRRDRGTFKIVLLDEAWALLSSSQGRALVAHLLRTGRAFNNAVYLVTQNVADLLDETVRSHVGVKFVFRCQDQAEVHQALQFLGLEPEDENVAALRQLEIGQALMQDLDGRVGVVQLDAVFPHLQRAFDTRPTAAARGVRI